MIQTIWSRQFDPDNLIQTIWSRTIWSRQIDPDNLIQTILITQSRWNNFTSFLFCAIFYSNLFFDREKFLGIHRMWKLGIRKFGSLKLKNLLYLLDMSFKVYRINYYGNSDNNELIIKLIWKIEMKIDMKLNMKIYMKIDPDKLIQINWSR